MGIGFEITGLDKIEDIKIQIKKKFSKEAFERIANDTAKFIYDEVMRAAPEDTGKLKSQITVTTQKMPNGYLITLKSGASYSSALEYGTIFIDIGSAENPKLVKSSYLPFMRPTMLKAVKFVKMQLKEEFSKI